MEIIRNDGYHELEHSVRENVKRVLRETNDEFTYGDTSDLGKGRHRQLIFYKEKPIGYLLTLEKNWIAPLQEKYILPDINYGLQPGDMALLHGKEGWIDFKAFEDYGEAFRYTSQNFEKLVYLFENGDYD